MSIAANNGPLINAEAGQESRMTLAANEMSDMDSSTNGESHIPIQDSQSFNQETGLHVDLFGFADGDDIKNLVSFPEEQGSDEELKQPLQKLQQQQQQQHSLNHVYTSSDEQSNKLSVKKETIFNSMDANLKITVKTFGDEQHSAKVEQKISKEESLDFGSQLSHEQKDNNCLLKPLVTTDENRSSGASAFKTELIDYEEKSATLSTRSKMVAENFLTSLTSVNDEEAGAERDGGSGDAVTFSEGGDGVVFATPVSKGKQPLTAPIFHE